MTKESGDEAARASINSGRMTRVVAVTKPKLSRNANGLDNCRCSEMFY